MRSSADLAQGTHLVRAREINGDPTLVSGVAGASTLAETFLQSGGSRRPYAQWNCFVARPPVPQWLEGQKGRRWRIEDRVATGTCQLAAATWTQSFRCQHCALSANQCTQNLAEITSARVPYGEAQRPPAWRTAFLGGVLAPIADRWTACAAGYSPARSRIPTSWLATGRQRGDFSPGWPRCCSRPPGYIHPVQ